MPIRQDSAPREPDVAVADEVVLLDEQGQPVGGRVRHGHWVVGRPLRNVE